MPAGYRRQVQQVAGVLGLDRFLGQRARPCPAACGAG